MIVPLLMPRLFCTAFELAGAICDGEVYVDARRVSSILGMMISFYGEDPGPYEVALATVATDVFSNKNTRACFLERVDAFDRLLADKGLIDAWGKHGWVLRNIGLRPLALLLRPRPSAPWTLIAERSAYGIFCQPRTNEPPRGASSFGSHRGSLEPRSKCDRLHGNGHSCPIRSAVNASRLARVVIIAPRPEPAEACRPT